MGARARGATISGVRESKHAPGRRHPAFTCRECQKRQSDYRDNPQCSTRAAARSGQQHHQVSDNVALASEARGRPVPLANEIEFPCGLREHAAAIISANLGLFRGPALPGFRLSGYCCDWTASKATHRPLDSGVADVEMEKDGNW